MMKLTKKEKASYGLGAVGKDMVYMLSAGYILYYYQDVMGVSAIAMGIILMAARVFDAFNDPIMGVIVAMIRQYLTSNMFALATSVLAGILSYGLLLAVSHNEVICKILIWRKKRRNFGEE